MLASIAYAIFLRVSVEDSFVFFRRAILLPPAQGKSRLRYRIHKCISEPPPQAYKYLNTRITRGRRTRSQPTTTTTWHRRPAVSSAPFDPAHLTPNNVETGAHLARLLLEYYPQPNVAYFTTSNRHTVTLRCLYLTPAAHSMMVLFRSIS